MFSSYLEPEPERRSLDSPMLSATTRHGSDEWRCVSQDRCSRLNIEPGPRAVYRIDIHFVDKHHPLSVTTNMTLASLHSRVRQHLRMGNERLSLACSVQDPFEPYDGPHNLKFRPLRKERDWEDVLGVVKQGFSVQRDELMVTVDVLRTATDATVRSICLQDSEPENTETNHQVSYWRHCHHIWTDLT